MTADRRARDVEPAGRARCRTCSTPARGGGSGARGRARPTRARPDRARRPARRPRAELAAPAGVRRRRRACAARWAADPRWRRSAAAARPRRARQARRSRCPRPASPSWRAAAGRRRGRRPAPRVPAPPAWLTVGRVGPRSPSATAAVGTVDARAACVADSATAAPACLRAVCRRRRGRCGCSAAAGSVARRPPGACCSCSPPARAAAWTSCRRSGLRAGRGTLLARVTGRRDHAGQ